MVSRDVGTVNSGYIPVNFHIHTHSHTNSLTYTHTHTFAHTLTRTYTHALTHTFTRTRMHTHTHTHAPNLSSDGSDLSIEKDDVDTFVSLGAGFDTKLF